MRTRTIAVILLPLLIVAHPDAQDPDEDRFEKLMQQAMIDPPGWPDVWPPVPPAPEPLWATAPLPEPSMTEPFAIGEGFYVESRLANAVVSLLGLMRIGIVADTSASAAGGSGASGLVLSQSEVRALIDLGMQDLEASPDVDNLPHSFADLHRAVGVLLPGVSVEQLAQAYTRAYEAQPDDLVAKALMGQPIEPDTRLTRTQIWFLLLDGFAGAAANGARWGTADRLLPDLPSPNPQWSAAEWREVIARLPLITASQLLTLEAPPSIAQAASANAAPVNITARAATAAPLVSRLSGKTLIPARAGSLAGHPLTWHLRPFSSLDQVGTIASPVGTPVQPAADGIARFVVQPGVDRTRGAGYLVERWETIEARTETRGLLASVYAVPPSIASMTFGASRSRANTRISFRSPDVLWFRIVNRYRGVNFEIRGLGGATRSGFDGVYGVMFKLRDGSPNGAYFGEAYAQVDTRQTLRGPGTCPDRSMVVSQVVYVLATKETSFGPTHQLSDFTWYDGPGRRGASMAAEPPDGGYFSLAFYPKTEPDLPRESPCLPFLPAQLDRTRGDAYNFIPFNDAQWTTPEQGYGIALRARGPTKYVDESSKDPLAGSSFLSSLKKLFELTGQSVWLVDVARKRTDIN